LRFPGKASFVLKCPDGVAAVIRRAGGDLGTRAHAFHGGDQARVETDRGVVSCGAIVVATNTPVNDLVAVHTKQAPYRSYVVAGRVPRGSVPEILLWDTPDSYHYVRIQRGAGEGRGVEYDLLMVGGEDHDRTDPTMG
jgi:glycine/D-amino acid oxidase-like deaminating enzyme